MTLLRFARSLYARDAVDRAASAYATLLDARVGEEGDDLVVRIDAETPGEILDNFANHVLFETVRLRQRAAEVRS